MSKYLLDTNICIFYMRGKYGLDKKMKEVGGRNCYISTITVAELLYGAACSNNPQLEKQRVSTLISALSVVSIEDSLDLFAETKAYLRKQGTLIDDFDLLIGTSALHHKMIVVTDNIKHISKIPNIKIENWIDR